MGGNEGEGAPTNLGKLKAMKQSKAETPAGAPTEGTLFELRQGGAELQFDTSGSGTPPLRIQLSTKAFRGTISLPRASGEPLELHLDLTARMGADGHVIADHKVWWVISPSQSAKGEIVTVGGLCGPCDLEGGEGFAEVFSVRDSKVTLIVVPGSVTEETATD